MAAASTPFSYFCPEFFSHFYFPSLARPEDNTGVSPSRYFAPTYFSPFFFSPLLPLAPVDSSESHWDYRDGDAYAAAVGLLKATGKFASVQFGTTAETRSTGADSYPAAVITPGSWRESEDADPNVIVRQLSFTISLIARSDDAFSGFEELDRLSSIVTNSLDGSDLGGGCLRALTRVQQGHFDTDSPYPERRSILQGECTYLISSPNNHCVIP